jgi:hypothetical protein
VSPRLLSYRGFRFHFFANEGTPREPPHVHVVKDGVDAKFWLGADVTVAYNDGFDARTIRELTGVVVRHRLRFLEAWHDFFGQAG